MATDKPTCSEPECRKHVKARGLCSMHYARLRESGDLPLLHPHRSGCEVSGCAQSHSARGYCARHFGNFMRTGNPVPKHERSVQARLGETGWDTTESGCWEWRGQRTQQGYGRVKIFSYGDRLVMAHRVSYEAFVGRIPDGLIIRHKCDNPPCINPEHLETGTKRDNTLDMLARGRGSYQASGKCKRGHDITASGAWHFYPSGIRTCRLCRELRQQRKKAENGRSGDSPDEADHGVLFRPVA